SSDVCSSDLAAPAAGPPDAHGAQGDRAPDAEPAFPDVERLDRLLQRVVEVDLPVGDDVVEASADQAEDHRRDGDVDDRAFLAAASAPSALAQPDGDDHAEHDAERVRPDRNESEVPDPLGGAGNGG